MMSNREYIDYIEDILDAIIKARSFIKGISFEKFQSDDKTIYAVIRALEVIGEATKRVPNNIRNQYPDIPWREMSSMRDKLIHDYFGIDLTVVWKTVTEDLPILESDIRRIVANSK